MKTVEMRQKKIYIYPITARGTDISLNPYINNLINCIEPFYHVVNKNNPSNTGIIQSIKYFWKTDIFFFNWVENLPDKKGGLLQSLLLFILIKMMRFFNKKVVWTMHNKISHSKKNYALKTLLFKILLKNANVIITHSTEGIKYAATITKTAQNNIHYTAHPVSVFEHEPFTNEEKVYDFVIWGAIIPYKGIHSFLEFLNNAQSIHNYKIYIIGKFSSTEYYEQIRSLAGNNTIIENRYATRDELQIIINKSRFTLFTYNNNSVLSSGALMDTLYLNTTIIGPNTGAFADLAALDMIKTYATFDNIIAIHKDESQAINISAKQQFIEENSWTNFGKTIHNLLQ